MKPPALLRPQHELEFFPQVLALFAEVCPRCKPVPATLLAQAREAAKAICKQRYLEFGCEGQGAKIKGDSSAKFQKDNVTMIPVEITAIADITGVVSGAIKVIDLDDPTLAALDSAKFGEAAQVAGVERGVEVEGVGDVAQRRARHPAPHKLDHRAARN